jgi:iron complex outermembrane receptor protein
VPVKNKNLIWELGFNVTYNKAEITSLYNSDAPGYKGIQVGGISGGTGNNIMIHTVGYAPFTFYPNQQVYTSDGSPIEGLFNDVDRNGIVDDKDRVYYKKPNADVMFGFSTGATYKKFSFGLTGHGMLGNYLYNNFNSNNSVLRNIINPVRYIGNAGVNYLDTRFTNNRYLSDYYIENASFFRLDNINLGYDLGKVINNKARLRLSANIQNVFVITKYSGADPENTGGIDNNIYPRPRIFTIGANLDF